MYQKIKSTVGVRLPHLANQQGRHSNSSGTVVLLQGARRILKLIDYKSKTNVPAVFHMRIKTYRQNY